jgi:hypothetical protein
MEEAVLAALEAKPEYWREVLKALDPASAEEASSSWRSVSLPASARKVVEDASSGAFSPKYIPPKSAEARRSLVDVFLKRIDCGF